MRSAIGSRQVLQHPLFAGVAAERVEPIVRRLAPITVERGTTLISGPSPGGATYLVLSGILHPYVVTPDGRRLVLEVVGSGGYDGLLAASGRVGHFCEAATDAVLVPLTMRTLNQLTAAEPRIALNLLNLTLTRLERREAHMLGMAHGDVVRGIAHQLLAIGHYAGTRDGDWIELVPRPPHHILAEMLGVRRETISIQLARLRRLGAVEATSRALRLNIRLLTRITEDRYEHTRRGRNRVA